MTSQGPASAESRLEVARGLARSAASRFATELSTDGILIVGAAEGAVATMALDSVEGQGALMLEAARGIADERGLDFIAMFSHAGAGAERCLVMVVEWRDGYQVLWGAPYRLDNGVVTWGPEWPCVESQIDEDDLMLFRPPCSVGPTIGPANLIREAGMRAFANRLG